MDKKPKRVGIYSGTFDPIHGGHIAFALQAARAAKLGVIYFVPERVPREKRQVTHFAHRSVMIRRAIRPYAHFGILELEDKTFSVAHTLPRLERKFPSATLVYLCGSDVVRHMGQWPHVTQLLQSMELCIGRRDGETVQEVERLLERLPNRSLQVTFVESHVPDVSSSKIRTAIRERRGMRGLLASVLAYATQEWLYL